MKCVFNQFFGIGDIMFIEPIMRKFFQEGNEIILPVMKQYMNLDIHFPYIQFVDKEECDIDYECQNIVQKGDMIIYPLRWSKEFFNSPLNDTMKNKYRMFNLPLEMWREFAFLRHRWKENKLINELGIDLNNDYALIIQNYHSYNKTSINIKLDTNMPIIELLPIEGYSLLDWVKIIENASEIHSVNTSTLFLFETLELKAKQIHLYSRNVSGRDFQQTEYLRSKNYILHD